MGDEVGSTFSRSVQKLDLNEDKPDLMKVFGNLSPDSQNSVKVLMQDIANGKVYLNVDDKGQHCLEYQERKKSYVDASQANLLARPRTEADVHDKVEACLELIDFLKHDKSPAGVVLVGSEVGVQQGRYREGFEFTRTKQVLGSGNSAGDIIVVKDKQTDRTHALKTVMISVFRKEEIQCWVDLTDTGYVPSLYLFKIKDNKVEIHMEIMNESLTMRSIIDDHMQKLDRTLIKPFSLYVLNGTLEAVSSMHGMNWTHKDLHGGNVMIQKSKEKMLDLKIIDFGLASQLETPHAGIDFRGFRSDIASLLRMFCALYVGNEFNNVQDIQSNWKDGLEKVTSQMSKEEKAELFCLVDSAMCILRPCDVLDYQKQIKEQYNRALHDIGKSEMDVLKLVAAKLFPEQTATQVKADDLDVADSWNVDADQVDEDQLGTHEQCGLVYHEIPENLVSDDFILKLRMSMSIGQAA